MRKIKISKNFKQNLSEKLMDLGNLAIAALIFGQLVGGKEFSAFILILGLGVAATCYLISFVVTL
ncbi:MAG TPA: hypothetical protein VLF68_00295 [Candidatus Saccharimonadales bacterium]|nr:hypothetical protein [Candidatus Saccharimonadales bacterium]